MLRGIAVAQRDVPRDRDPTVAEHGLEEVLVHADGRCGDSGPDVRYAGELQEALNRAVLAERAVEDRKDDVDVAENRRGRRLGDDGQRLEGGFLRGREALPAVRDLPAAVPADLDRRRLVSLGVERLEHGARGLAGDRVLARASAGEHGDAKPAAHEVGVVVVDVAVKRPTKSVTTVFGFACVPPSGSCEMTIPSNVLSSVSSRTIRVLKPAASSVVSAIDDVLVRDVRNRRRRRARARPRA